MKLPIIVCTIAAAFLWPQVMADCDGIEHTLSVCEVTSRSTEYVGKHVVLRGRIRIWPHDMLMISENCPDSLIVVTWTDSTVQGASADFQTLRDSRYRRLRRLARKDLTENQGLVATFT